MITVLHVITGLSRGGAEGALSRLVQAMNREEFRSVVVSLRDLGAWGPKLRAAGITVHALDAERWSDGFAALRKLQRIARELQPHIVQSWLYHADLMATLARPRTARLAWNIRNSDLSQARRWRALVATLATLSRAPDVVVANANSGLHAHLDAGYRPRRSIVIPNGVDTDEFKPNPAARVAARRAFGLPETSFIIGMPARADAAKDHATFFAAAAAVLGVRADATFAIAGVGANPRNASLKEAARSVGLDGRIAMLDEVDDMPALYAALDVVALTSVRGEGFPNVVAEAMACGLPVVATDDGDVRRIVGDAGHVVPRGDVPAVAKAMKQCIAAPPEARSALGARARARIEANFSLAAATAAYQQLYRELARK